MVDETKTKLVTKIKELENENKQLRAFKNNIELELRRVQYWREAELLRNNKKNRG